MAYVYQVYRFDRGLIQGIKPALLSVYYSARRVKTRDVFEYFTWGHIPTLPLSAILIIFIISLAIRQSMCIVLQEELQSPGKHSALLGFDITAILVAGFGALTTVGGNVFLDINNVAQDGDSEVVLVWQKPSLFFE